MNARTRAAPANKGVVCGSILAELLRRSAGVSYELIENGESPFVFFVIKGKFGLLQKAANSP